jgi:hypothetical protein
MTARRCSLCGKRLGERALVEDQGSTGASKWMSQPK